MANLSPTELLRYGWRSDKFIEKYRNQEPFELVSGQKAQLFFDEDVYEKLLSKRSSEYQSLVFTDAKVKTRKYRFSSFKMSVEFGGKTTENRSSPVGNIIDELNKVRSITGNTTVPIRIRNLRFDVSSCVEIDAGKANIALLDQTNREVIWIKHIDGSTPRDVGEWSSLNEPGIQDHPEVRTFMQQMQEKYPSGVPENVAVAKSIEDIILKNRAVYGNSFKSGQSFGPTNLSLILQGTVHLEKFGNAWRFDSTFTHENGEPVIAGYEPTLVASTGQNFAIQPKMSRKITEWIKQY